MEDDLNDLESISEDILLPGDALDRNFPRSASHFGNIDDLFTANSEPDMGLYPGNRLNGFQKYVVLTTQ